MTRNWTRNPSARSQRRKVRARRRPCLEGLEDRTLLSTFAITNNRDDGSEGSLRWAITQANNNPGPDTIDA